MSTLSFEWEVDGKMKKEEFQFPTRFLFRFEPEHLIERSLFQDYKIFGDYKGDELNTASKEFIFVCEKT